ncbi:hypothetical protein AU467_34985 [Mesorhizobium loti]|uniref:Uncharacterized protein n=1 Tax=Rhizobium loti TaxID=381 RepID=A0A101KWM9_RHILI|nr:hypothetical protein AU467_34985 [Mesorhizobium loti]
MVRTPLPKQQRLHSIRDSALGVEIGRKIPYRAADKLFGVMRSIRVEEKPRRHSKQIVPVPVDDLALQHVEEFEPVVVKTLTRGRAP